jgi:hypothetical protein
LNRCETNFYSYLITKTRDSKDTHRDFPIHLLGVVYKLSIGARELNFGFITVLGFESLRKLWLFKDSTAWIGTISVCVCVCVCVCLFECSDCFPSYKAKQAFVFSVLSCVALTINMIERYIVETARKAARFTERFFTTGNEIPLPINSLTRNDL